MIGKPITSRQYFPQFIILSIYGYRIRDVILMRNEINIITKLNNQSTCNTIILSTDLADMRTQEENIGSKGLITKSQKNYQSDLTDQCLFDILLYHKECIIFTYLKLVPKYKNITFSCVFVEPLWLIISSSTLKLRSCRWIRQSSLFSVFIFSSW